MLLQLNRTIIRKKKPILILTPFLNTTLNYNILLIFHKPANRPPVPVKKSKEKRLSRYTYCPCLVAFVMFSFINTFLFFTLVFPGNNPILCKQPAMRPNAYICPVLVQCSISLVRFHNGAVITIDAVDGSMYHASPSCRYSIFPGRLSASKFLYTASSISEAIHWHDSLFPDNLCLNISNKLFIIHFSITFHLVFIINSFGLSPL